MKGFPHKIKVAHLLQYVFIKLSYAGCSKCTRIEESSEEIRRNAKREELISTRVKKEVSME